MIPPEFKWPLRLIPDTPVKRWNIPLVRRLMAAAAPRGIAKGVQVREHVAGTLRLRVYTPEGVQGRAAPTGALLWIHGGGYVLGQPRQNDLKCSGIARDLGIVVTSVYYRRAPEHPFPAALDDCYAGWQWLQGQAQALNVDPARVAVGGESAGGGLAACVVQRIHDAGGTQPACQLLDSPMLDDRTAARRELDHPRNPLWNNESNYTGWSLYLGQEPGSASAPPYSVAARRVDLSGLPPAWIGVGTPDLFLTEDREYARRLRAAGVSCQLEEIPGAVHAFDSVLPRAKLSIHYGQLQRDFLRRYLVRD